MKNYLLLLILLNLFPLSNGQNISTKSQDEHLLPDKITFISNHTINFDSLIAGIMQTNHIPGLAAAIVNKSKIIWEGYYGFANISENDLVDTNTIFMLASISKTVTGSALMKLFELGYFQLDDSINAYLPFTVRNPNHPEVPITFRQLLTHSSSIRDNFSYYIYYWGTDPLITLGYYLENYLTPGGLYYSGNNYSNSAPGTYVDYCNIGAALCGYLAEVISGKPFNILCRDSLFTPLNLDNTGWFLRELDTSLIAHPYTWNGSNYTDHGYYGFASYPDGQLRTTTRSLSKWLIANINYGVFDGVRVLDSTTVKQMRTIQYPVLEPGLGLIWWKYQLNQRWLWGHDGGDFGVSTTFSLDENNRTGIVVLANITGNNNIWSALAELVDQMYLYADDYLVGIKEQEITVNKFDFLLSQNYPNPFNPSTIINYQLPVSSKVSLKVYDILGREIATLVDEEKPVGSYEVEFKSTVSSHQLASGIYYYQLSAGDYVQTKKMVLIK